MCRFSQGTLGTDKKFTGQRLDGTGLYYYNARYYDPLIGRFISADTAAPDLMNPQSFNKYSYCFNNPLNRNDPTGNWPNWSNIGKAISNATHVVVNSAKAVVESAKAVVEQAKDKANEEKQAAEMKAAQTVNNIITHMETAVGINSITQMNTSLAQNVPVINVRQGSPLDKALFFTDSDVTISPLVVFSKQPMDPRTEEEEGYHWNDQKNSKNVVGWYVDYTVQYGMYLALYGGNEFYAHNAVSYERDAMSYAANQTGVPYTPPPSLCGYWWYRIFGQ